MRRIVLLCICALLGVSCSLIDGDDPDVGRATVEVGRATRVRAAHDDQVLVTIPKGGAPAGAILTVQAPAATPPPSNTVAMPLGHLVEISLDRGRLTTPATIDLAFDPSSLPAGAGPEDVFAASWHPTLQAWLPAPGTVEVASHRVRVTTDHFSQWWKFVWRPDKLGQLGVEAIRQVTKQTADDALAVPERLVCNAPNVEVRPLVDDPRGALLDACINQAAGGYALHLSNRHAIPLLFDLPAGVIDQGPIDPDRPLDSLDFLLEAKVHKEVPTATLVRGGKTRVFRVGSSAARGSVTLRGNLRVRVVVTDVFLYLTKLMVPELGDKRSWRRLKATVRQFDAAMDGLDCVWGAANAVAAAAANQLASKLWGVWTECFPRFLGALQGLSEQASSQLRDMLSRPLRALDAAMEGAKFLPEYIEALQIAGFRLTGEEAATRPALVTASPFDADEQLWGLLQAFLRPRDANYYTAWQQRSMQLHNDQPVGRLPVQSNVRIMRGDCRATVDPVHYVADLDRREGASINGFYLPGNAVGLIIYQKDPPDPTPPLDCSMELVTGETLRMRRTDPPPGLKLGNRVFAVRKEGIADSQRTVEEQVLAVAGKVTISATASTFTRAQSELVRLARYIDRTLGTEFVKDAD